MDKKNLIIAFFFLVVSVALQAQNTAIINLIAVVPPVLNVKFSFGNYVNISVENKIVQNIGTTNIYSNLYSGYSIVAHSKNNGMLKNDNISISYELIIDNDSFNYNNCFCAKFRGKTDKFGDSKNISICLAQSTKEIVSDELMFSVVAN